jgi:hypothetical protein
VVLDDGGDEAAGFLKVEIHCAYKIKNPPGDAGGRPFIRFTEKSADRPSRVGMVTMMMPGDGLSGHESRVYQVAEAESNEVFLGSFGWRQVIAGKRDDGAQWVRSVILVLRGLGGFRMRSFRVVHSIGPSGARDRGRGNDVAKGIIGG